MGYQPMKPYSSGPGYAVSEADRVGQAATQTHIVGAPLVLTSGYLQECAFSGAELIYGLALEDGQNLSVAGTGENLSNGTVIGQASAEVIPVGARMSDGNMGVVKALANQLLWGNLLIGQVFTVAMIGTVYGITKDSTTKVWYIDNTDTSGDNVVAKVIGVDPSSPNTTTEAAVIWQVDRADRFFQ